MPVVRLPDPMRCTGVAPLLTALVPIPPRAGGHRRGAVVSGGPGREPSRDTLLMVRRIRSIRTPDDVYHVVPGRGETLPAVRKRLQRASRSAGVDTVIVRCGRGYLIGLATPERVCHWRRRGRP